MPEILLGVLAFLIGSFPSGWLISRYYLGVDIQSKGSGNIGMTNVMRVGGKAAGIWTFVLDFGKGALVIWLAQWWLGPEADRLLIGALGVTAVCGHVYSVFLKLKGGKGVATTLGVLAAFMWPIGALAGLLWVGVFAISRISSLSALVMLGGMPLLFVLYPWWMEGCPAWRLSALFGGLSALLIYKHADNIQRLLGGDEKTLV